MCANHKFQENDTIFLTNLQGNDVEFLNNKWLIKNVDNYSFNIISTENKLFDEDLSVYGLHTNSLSGLSNFQVLRFSCAHAPTMKIMDFP